MKFPQRDTWYRKLVQRSIQAFFPRKEARSLRSRLLAMIGICALLVSGLTFAVASVGATIAWPTAPAGEATGGTMITYFKNMFGDPATGMGKSCSGSGVITGFDANGTPRCSSLSDLGWWVPWVPVLTFSAMNTAIMSGSTATLNWNTTNVSSCTKWWDWLGILAGNQPNQSLTTSALTSNKMYILICSNSVGTSVIQTVNITVTAPTTPSILMLTLPSTVNAGSSVTILWNATPVTSCTTTGPSSGDTSTWAATGLSWSGSRTFIPTISGNYTMTCSNGSVSSSQSVTITVSTSCFTFNAPTGTITAYSSTCPKDVVIPSMISGFAVQHIGNSAFNGNQLTSVTIPGSVESIGNSAFTNNLLISVTISEGVKSIGNSAFYINLLTSVTIPGSVENIEAAAFNDNKLTSVTISEGVKSIGRHAFYINQLTSVTIPGSVESIETAAFNDNKLTSITIPDSVTTIGGHAFGNQNSSNGTVYGPSSGYVKDTYNLNSGNQFDKVHLPNYVVTP